MKIYKKLIKHVISVLMIFVPAFFYYLMGGVTLCGFYGIGDICYELSFLDSFKDLNKRKIRVLVSKNRIRFFRFFPAVDKISTISLRLESWILDDSNFESWYLKSHKFLFFVSHYRYFLPNDNNLIHRMNMAYGVPSSAKITYPVPYKNEDIKISNNIILINKLSNSFRSDLIHSFLCSLAEVLIQSGYKVIFNDHKAFTLNQILCNAHKFKAIISIRSGFLDFLVNTNSNLICLYDKSRVGKNLKEKMGFSLKCWQGSSKINEFYVEDVSIDDVINAM